MHWYKDAEDVRTYMRSRARVFMSGHEHDPKVAIDTVEDGCEVMMLAAGAAVPSKSNEVYTYTYNVIEFDWDEELDALAVTIHPRAWNSWKTCFEADEKRLGGREPRFALASPNFRKSGKTTDHHAGAAQATHTAADHELVVELVAADSQDGETLDMPTVAEGYELALLRFFRDLLESERLKILVELDAIPADSDERMTQGVERRLFEWLVRAGRLPSVIALIDKHISERKDAGH